MFCDARNVPDLFFWSELWFCPSRTALSDVVAGWLEAGQLPTLNCQPWDLSSYVELAKSKQPILYLTFVVRLCNAQCNPAEKALNALFKVSIAVAPLMQILCSYVASFLRCVVCTAV